MKAVIHAALAVSVALSTVVAWGQVPASRVQVAPAGATPRPAASVKEPLGVGSPAPAIKVAKWYKGTPVTELKEGQVYVMEFWATWCGPCIAAMPHVTELAKKHEGKATIIGVSVWERPAEKTNEAIDALVKPFVESQGEKMGYNVAAEGADGFMATNWLAAAGQNGIPCSMIIGKDKKIAWIGHPMGMDEPLEKIIAGTWDVKAEAARYAEARAKKEAQAALLSAVRDAMGRNDPKGVVTAIDSAIEKNPEMESQLFPVKFEALVQSDEAAAFAFLKKWYENGGAEKEPVNGYNAFIGLSRHAEAVKKPDWALMAQVLDKVNTVRGKKDPQIMAAQAAASFKAGDKKTAVECQEKALELAASSSNVPAAWVDAQKKKLDEYKAK